MASKVRMAKRAGPTCTSTETWWNNAQGATPCDVYQSVMDRCNFTAPTLTNNDAYYPVLQAQECMCNTVAYNLGSACQDCQRGSTDQGILFAVYTTGGDTCPTQSTALPDSFPTDNIPLWAFIDTSTQFWSYLNAQQVAVNQTSPTTSSSQPSSTGTTPTMSNSIISTTVDSTPTAAPVAHKSTNAGAIGGGVAGGVVLILAIIGLLLFWRRRRARRSQDGAGLGAVDGEGGRNPSASSESSLTESAKATSGASHYTPHSQMAQLNQRGGSDLVIASYSTTSALTSNLTTPVDAPPMPTLSQGHTSPDRSFAMSSSPSSYVPPTQNKVKRVPVRYSEDDLVQAEQAEQGARKTSARSSIDL